MEPHSEVELVALHNARQVAKQEALLHQASGQILRMRITRALLSPALILPFTFILSGVTPSTVLLVALSFAAILILSANIQVTDNRLNALYQLFLEERAREHHHAQRC